MAQAQTGTGIIRVATTGSDAPDCGGEANPCRTVQYAVDQAAAGAEIRVAAGTYTDVHMRPRNDITTIGVVTQVAYITKTVTIRGGYTPVNWTMPNPEANPTILNAQSKGRVVYIAGSISPTLEGLRLTGGNSTGLGGRPGGFDSGGGVYIISATVTMNGNHVFGNTAFTGGGLWLYNSASVLSGNMIYLNTSQYCGGLRLYYSPATLNGNTIVSNTVVKSGGGVCLDNSDATLVGNTISANTAAQEGGGLSLSYSAATLSGNIISGNLITGSTTSGSEHAYGGGLFLDQSPATLIGNTISNNSATHNFYARGGGLLLSSSAATLYRNILSNNSADGNSVAWGGGLCLTGASATLRENTVSNNWANSEFDSRGGGLFIGATAATLDSNVVISNTASGSGGGMYLSYNSAILDRNTISSNTAQSGGGAFLNFDESTLSNNVIADNQATVHGGGLYGLASFTRLMHTTIVRNLGGDGSGIYLDNPGTLQGSHMALTNTILASHTVGIVAASGNTATLQATLWYGNGQDWAGSGKVITGTHDYWGDPVFVEPAQGDYHIGLASAAIDRGVDVGVSIDIDGDPRPAAFGFDLGADERPGTALLVRKTAWPLIVMPGQTITYTLALTSAGVSTATQLVLTDTLPTTQKLLAVTATQGTCVQEATWNGDVVCDLGTLPPGRRVDLTLTAQVSTTLPPQLPWLMHNTAQATAIEAASNVARADTLLHNCHVRVNNDPTGYVTVQAAVDAAKEGDVVKVAGTCVGVNTHGGLRQQVYLSKTLTLRGGYTIDDWTTPDPANHLAVLDVRGEGRALYITGDISVTIEGLRLTGGNATGLGGGSAYWCGDCNAGGGVYVITATVILVNLRPQWATDLRPRWASEIASL